MNLLGFDLRLGAPATISVSSERHRYWKWLARSILPRTGSVQSLSQTNTLYLDANDIQQRPALVTSLILDKVSEVATKQQVDCVIVDLSGNAYYLLRDTLLCHLAVALQGLSTARLCRGACIVLPQLPAASSLFWVPLESIGDAMAVVVSATGDWRAFPMGARRAPRNFARSCQQWQASMQPPLDDVLERTLLRKLGHFRRPGPKGEFCGRYFFDFSLGIEEVGHAFFTKVSSLVDQGVIPLPRTLAAFAPMSPWLFPAALLMGDEFDPTLPVLDLAVLPATSWKNEVSSREDVLVLTDLVHTGRASQEAIYQLVSQGIVPLPIVLSALSSSLTNQIMVDGFRFDVEFLLNRNPRVSPRAECYQCRLGLPYSSIDEETYFGLASFDAWDMFSSSRWIEERDVPPGSPALAASPDIAHMIEQFGDYLAFKIEDRLRSMGFGDEVVIACPDEMGARSMLDFLRVRFRNRLVAVLLPRTVLTSVSVLDRVPRDSPLGFEDLGPSGDALWLQQLDHLARKRVPVVLLDEFNASGTTARAMFNLLQGVGVAVAAYISVINRAPEALQDLPIPIYSLYEIESPRRL